MVGNLVGFVSSLTTLETLAECCSYGIYSDMVYLIKFLLVSLWEKTRVSYRRNYNG